MATKSYILNFFLIFFCGQLFAQNNEQLLSKWTKENETGLREKYQLIDSVNFKNQCLQLAHALRLNQINRCELFESEQINAFVFNNGHVYFSTAMMKLINNKHQWASILAHESAHIELNHYLKNIKTLKNPPLFFPKSKYKKQLKKQEQQADEWAKGKLLAIGFDPNQIYFFLQRVDKLTKSKRSNTHLKLSKRMKKNKSKELITAGFDLIFE